MALEELLEDPRFSTNADRVAHRAELVPVLAQRVAEHSTEEMLQLTNKASVPCSAIHDLGQVMAHPQVVASEIIKAAPHPTIPGYRDLELPFRLEGEWLRSDRPPPAAGEHQQEILAELEIHSEPSEG
jgi:crotonobetainyl-CoA:carnitine CoA-transferase CaiB-like acyl-CoA transferase